ncbi:MAG: hypothetical protein RLZZ293_1225 [Pseudomonadota bacterium]|jgi:hypothetical protein
MANTFTNLDDILNDPELADLLNVKSSATPINADQRLINSFEEINQFIDQYSKPPQANIDINQRKLHARLVSLQSDHEKIRQLKAYDRHNLLPTVTNDPNSLNQINDLYADPLLANLLADNPSDLDLFDVKEINNYAMRQASDFVARRKICRNFAIYEPLFAQCQADLTTGKRKLVKFNWHNLAQSTYFVVNGILGYLAEVGELTRDKNNKLDGRIYCVFENGTESNMLYRSLGKIIHENGNIVSATENEDHQQFKHGFSLNTNLEATDQATGIIYVLKSKTTNPQLSQLTNLYKIGYSSGAIEQRLKNAHKQTTYLLADVEVVAVYECYNLNPAKFEQLIHRFFARVCLDLELYDEDGIAYRPREWFIVPLAIINQAIELLISGEIINFYYCPEQNHIKLISTLG